MPSRASTPMAASTCETRYTPAEQAEPADASTPSESSSMSMDSASAPGKSRCAWPARRGSVAVTFVLGTAATTRSMSWSRRPAIRAFSASRSSSASRKAAAVAAAAATSTVPGRSPRSWPPPSTTGRGTGERLASRMPEPRGPPNLCALAASVVAPDAWKSTSTLPTACTASTCNGVPAAFARSAASRTGWIAPVSLFAHMSVATAAGSSSAERSRTWPPRSGSSHETSAPSVCARDLTVSKTAECSIVLATTRRGAPSFVRAR